MDEALEQDIDDFRIHHKTRDVRGLHGILGSPYKRLGGYKALCFGTPQFMPEGWRQWIVFLWGTDIWFGRWPFCKCVVAVNVLVWVLGGR